MLPKTEEIKALFSLIDDPDEEVFSTIANRLLDYGTPIIPDLEHLWENTLEEATLERIERMIYQLRLKDIQQQLIEWSANPKPSLFEGALILVKYQFPELALDPLRHQLEKIRRNIWLELNNYLTPLEQANVIRNILFSYYQIKGVEVNYENPEDFLVSSPLQSKPGNAFANSLIYAELCQQLEIHAEWINIPKQCILAYFSADWEPHEIVPNPQEFIQFYVEGTSGHPFSQKDMDQYFLRHNIEPKTVYYKRLSNQRVIKKMILEFAKCFNSPTLQFKREDLIALAGMIDQEPK
ncbi:MAG: hypothetical protein RL387_1827 [Bacteroidota bacterium]|jgi:hypothetical protein